MSLIKAALDKTSQLQATKNGTLSPRACPRDPVGETLEQELVQIQKQYAFRRNVFWMAGIGVLAAVMIGGFFYAGRSNAISSTPPVRNIATVAVPTAPLSVSGRIQKNAVILPFRLTGITNLGQSNIAVINDLIVHEGDFLPGNAEVLEIGNGKVRLSVQGKEVLLTL